MSTTASLPELSTLPPVTAAPRGRVALVISFLLLLNFVYFLFSSGRVHTIDEVSAAFQVESLAKRGTSAIPQAVNANLFYGTFDRFGRPQSPYPPGQALALLPWYAAGQFVANHLPGVSAERRDIVSDFFLTGESAFFSALAAALALGIFLRLGIPPKTSLTAAGILALATPLAAYSGWLFSEPLATALLVGAALALFSHSHGSRTAPPSKPTRIACQDASNDARIVDLATDDPASFVGHAFGHDVKHSLTPGPLTPSMVRTLAAGALLGAAVWVRPTHVIAVPVFLAALFVRDRKAGWRPATLLALAVGAGVTLLLWRNAYLHGGAFDFGYPSAAEAGKVINTFQTPLATGLLGFLASPGKSIFLFSPPIFLALLGLPRLWRRDRGLAVVAAAAPVVYLLFFATYSGWDGGYCYGPRYVIPALTLLGLAIAPALDGAPRNLRLVAITLFVAGFLVQALGMTTSFLEADITGGYYDAQYNYRMGFSPIAMHVHLLLHYATSGPAPIGQGFDKWWVFLSKAGVSSRALSCLAAVLMACGAGTVWLLRQFFHKAAEGD